MSALIEHIIAARGFLKRLTLLSDYEERQPIIEARQVLADAANALTERDGRIKELEAWWYAVPEEQRFGIMSDAAWNRHEAARAKP